MADAASPPPGDATSASVGWEGFVTVGVLLVTLVLLVLVRSLDQQECQHQTCY
jgi:hypothetical protein